MFELYDYQINLINDIKKKLKKKSICIVAPCGSGKSVIQGSIAASATKKGNRVLFLVHRKELCEQIENTFKLCKVDFNLCQVGMVQTIVRRLDKEPEPTIIITDENHHCLAKNYRKIYDHFPDAILLGFTATPIRLGGKGLHPVYNDMVVGPSVKWLVDNKFLASYKLYSKKLVDTSKLHIRNGDFKSEEVNELMETGVIYGDTLKNWKELANNKKTIIYASSIKASKATESVFLSAGIPTKHLDGETPKKEREQAIKDFRENKITVLCNVDLFGEGFDIPDCECVTLLRPTKSLSLYIQQSMRSMRYQEGKKAIIIDHVGNCFEHNLPDYEYNWTLKDKSKKKSYDEKEEKIKTCKQCFAVLNPGTEICPYCGYVFPKQVRKEKKVIESELTEILPLDVIARKPMNYYLQFTKLSDLIDFAQVKRYKKGWLWYKMQERKEYLKATAEDFKRLQAINGYKRGWWVHEAKKWGIIE